MVGGDQCRKGGDWRIALLGLWLLVSIHIDGLVLDLLEGFVLLVEWIGMMMMMSWMM